MQGPLQWIELLIDTDSTPSPSKQLPDIVRLPRRSSSAMSIGAKLATDGYITSSPDQEDADISVPTITNEAIPMLRKAKSSTTRFKLVSFKTKVYCLCKVLRLKAII